VKLGVRDFHHQQNPKLKSSIYVNLSDSMEPLQEQIQNCTPNQNQRAKQNSKQNQTRTGITAKLESKKGSSINEADS